MQPGYELDKAVAEAIDHVWEETTDCFITGVEYDHEAAIMKCRPSHWNFHPSTDWDDAMLAAEKCGLFGDMEGQCQLSTTERIANPRRWTVSQWTVYEQESYEGAGDEKVGCPDIVEHESGPVAVSLAILKLKGKANGT